MHDPINKVRPATMVVLLALALAAPAHGAPLPPPVSAMIEAAAGDPAALKAVVDAAKKTNPQSMAEIDAMVAAIEARAAAEKAQKIASQTFFQGWSGEGELGAFLSTGNVEDVGLVLALGLSKETTHWRHSVTGAIDYQETDNTAIRERFFLGYNGNYKINERLYAYLLLSAERDTFAGFDSRFTQSVGFGYRAIDRGRLKLDVEGGPALRQTSYIDGSDEFTVSGRIAGNLAWTIAPNATFTQSAVAFIESSNSTFNAVSAVSTKMSDALSLRASFDVRHETDPPLGRKSTDTTTRITIVYDF
mgnify:CR=1 FL=1